MKDPDGNPMCLTKVILYNIKILLNKTFIHIDKTIIFSR